MDKFDELVNKPGPGGFARPKQKPDAFAAGSNLHEAANLLRAKMEAEPDHLTKQILRRVVDAWFALEPNNEDAIEARRHFYTRIA